MVSIQYQHYEMCIRDRDYIGRTEFDSPEVDPEVLIERGDRALHIGCLLYTSRCV